MPVGMQRLEQECSDRLMDLSEPPDTGGRVHVQTDVIRIQRRSLPRVIALDELVETARELAVGRPLTMLLDDRRAVAVRTGHEQDILRPDPIAQEPREHIGMHKHTADVPEMQVLISVRHAPGNHSAFREARPWLIGNESRCGSIRHLSGVPISSRDGWSTRRAGAFFTT